MKTINDLRIFDNGGASVDRYTVLPARWDKEYREKLSWNCFFSGNDPRTISGWGLASYGAHLGKRVAFSALNDSVQQAIKSAFSDYREA